MAVSAAEENITFYSHSLALEPRLLTAPCPGSVSQEGRGKYILICHVAAPPPTFPRAERGCCCESFVMITQTIQIYDSLLKEKETKFPKSRNKWNPARVWRKRGN